MTRSAVAWALLMLLQPALAQSPAEIRPGRQPDVHGSQASAGAAYRALQDAQYESKLAEQDVLNTRDAYEAARRQAAELKQQLDAAEKARVAARAKEAEARKRYEAALTGVDRAFGESVRK